MTDVKTAPVANETFKAEDTSAQTGSANPWSGVANRMWETLKAQYTSVEPMNPPSSGNTGGDMLTPAKPAPSGIAYGDGPSSGKKSPIDEEGFIHFGDILSNPGDKLPPDDSRGVVNSEGKFNREGGAMKKPPGMDNRGVEHAGGKVPPGGLTGCETDNGEGKENPTSGRTGSAPYFPELPSTGGRVPTSGELKGTGTDHGEMKGNPVPGRVGSPPYVPELPSAGGRGPSADLKRSEAGHGKMKGNPVLGRTGSVPYFPERPNAGWLGGKFNSTDAD